jgi:hypothetical protein
MIDCEDMEIVDMRRESGQYCEERYVVDEDMMDIQFHYAY